MTPFLPRFMVEYPGIELDLRMSDALVDLVGQRIDVAIRLGALESSRLIALRLVPRRRIVCASPAYLAHKGRPLAPTDLASHACLPFAFCLCRGTAPLALCQGWAGFKAAGHRSLVERQGCPRKRTGTTRSFTSSHRDDQCQHRSSHGSAQARPLRARDHRWPATGSRRRPWQTNCRRQACAVRPHSLRLRPR